MIKSFQKREIYIRKVKPFIDKNIIKVFTGQRRVGKSYMLFQVMDILRKKGVKENQIIYINKELNEFAQLKDHNDLISYIEKKIIEKVNYYLFIDEVQEIENFEKGLDHFFAKRNIDIYCTGSNANMLSGELASVLSGRYIEIKIFGLSYKEFFEFHNLQDDEETFLKYMRYGGLPFLKNLLLEDQIVYDYLRNIYDAILFKDIVKRHAIRNVSFLERLVEFVCDNIGSILSAKKISDFLKSQKINISPNIVMDYLSFLEQAFFVYKLKRKQIRGKKIFEIGEKYYLEDMGLRHSISGYRQTDINKIFENIVFLHLLIAGYTVHVGKDKDREVDFICEKGGNIEYFQVAYLLSEKKTIEREFNNLLDINDNFPKTVISADKYIQGEYKGIKHINIREFLKNVTDK
ncbi:MAG: ATP-binding protein [Candidatus Omnitrophica bacterium]|nr:ATP-binding protein [Candidatus Omnitrophota bacterium]